MALLLLVTLVGCGGGGGSSSSTIPPADTTLFTPNYVASLDSGVFHWDHLPVKFGFILPNNWATLYPTDQSLDVDAANEWNRPSLQVLTSVVDPSQADVKVTFVSQSQLGGSTEGITHFTFDGTGRMLTASIQVALDIPGGGFMPAGDAQTIIAHEIGHALGIGGHSPNSDDLMFPVHTFGTFVTPSVRDFNTIMTSYPTFFGKGIRGPAQGNPNEIFSRDIE